MSKVLLQSDLRKNKSSMIKGILVSADSEGVAEIPVEMEEVLLSDQYAFMGWGKVEENDIQKIEEEDLSPIEKGDPIEPVIKEEKTPAELIEEVEKTTDETSEEKEYSIQEIIEGTEELAGLKEIAETLELPKEEWEGYKRKDYFKNYLLKAVEDAE